MTDEEMVERLREDLEAQQIENARLLDENEILQAAMKGHDEAVQHWGRMIDERDAENKVLRAAVKDRDEQIQRLSELLEKREAEIDTLNGELDEALWSGQADDS